MRNFLLSLLGAALLSCGWLGGTGIALLIALVPLLVIADGYGSGGARFWPTAGFVALTLGLWSGATTWWIAVVPGGWPGAMMSVLITVVLFGTVLMLYGRARRMGVPRGVACVLLVAGWIAAEWLYTVGELSFPWLTLGNGFAGDVRAVQWYEMTGVFGGSLWVWLCNILIYTALRHRTAVGWAVAAGFVALPLGASLVRYHSYAEAGREVTVTAVQPNFFAAEKFAEGGSQVDTMLALAGRAPEGVDYIIFPETAVDLAVDERIIGDEPTVVRFRELLRERYPHARIILGATTMRVYGGGERPSSTARETNGGLFYDVYNSSLEIDTTRRVAIHHKSKLVVGAERMPYAGRFRWLDRMILDLGGTTGNLATESVPAVFPRGDGVTVGAPVCWEGVFGEWFGEFVQRGANLMMIISNDSWWGDTRGYRQLFKFSRLRAIESRRSIARSANTGISGFINQRGDVLSRTGWDERTTITGTIATNDHVTFYSRAGDYIARIASFTFGLCVLYCVAFRFRRKSV
jgi:apolipoprotein N-acyltransferase